MLKTTTISFFGTILVLTLIFALPCLGTQNNYTENFTTISYKDSTKTTADWNTQDEEVRLFPFVPSLVGNYNTPSQARDVAISGSYAFVADAISGLQVIDINDPQNPLLAGSCDTPGDARGIVLSDYYAFVADLGSGLQVINIQDPFNPVLIATLDTPGDAWDVAVSGDCVFVADNSFGLQVIDISDPANPVLLGTYDTPGFARGIAASGDFVYMASRDSGIQVIDVFDPSNPALMATYDTPGDAWDVTVAGSNVFVADGASGLLAIDISDPTVPVLIGSYDTPSDALGILVSGNSAFVSDNDTGVMEIDVADPSNPYLLETFDTTGSSWSAAVEGNMMYVADLTSGLQIFNIKSTMNPVLVGSVETIGSAYDLVVSGDFAYVASGGLGLQVFDISDISSPVLLGSYVTPDYARDVVVSGSLAYVAVSGSGLYVVDVSDPTNPTLQGICDTPNSARGITIAGDCAYVADSFSGLQIINITNPAIPVIVGSYDTPDYAYGVAVYGDYAIVADGETGLVILNISDTTTPALISITPLHDYPHNRPIGYNVALYGEYAYVASDQGVILVRIADPYYPTVFWSVAYYSSEDVVLVNGIVFSSGSAGLEMTIGESSVLTELPGSGEGLTLDGEHVFVADGSGGLQVLTIFQNEFIMEDNEAQSLFVDTANDSIFRVRLATTETDSVHWQLSSNGGVNWQECLPGSDWIRIANPGTDLNWRSTLEWLDYGDNPTVSDLQIDWLVSSAATQNILDIPGDQGGWVQTQFTRSTWDFADETARPIAHYGVWRMVADRSIKAMNSSNSKVSEYFGMSVVQWGDETYVQSLPDQKDSTFPPGTWAWVATIPAVQQDTYTAIVPTAADSTAAGTNHTVFVITTHTTTPSIWYVSEPDSGYSMDNIAPESPTSVVVTYQGESGNQLSWDSCPDDDFQFFNIYSWSEPGFIPSPANLVQSTSLTNWVDQPNGGWGVYYQVTALDYVGNESEPTSPGGVSEVSPSVIPTSFQLHGNIPNPFNPSTLIQYDVPAMGGLVKLKIYDVSGTLVRTLEHGMQTAGQKTVTWNGKDDQGRSSASGVYFYRLQAPGYEKTMKMLLVQ